MRAEVHAEVERAVAQMAGQIERDVVEAEADDALTPPVLDELRRVRRAPRRQVDPAERAARHVQREPMDDAYAHRDARQPGQLRRRRVQPDDAVAGDGARVKRHEDGAARLARHHEAADRLDDGRVAHADVHLGRARQREPAPACGGHVCNPRSLLGNFYIFILYNCFYLMF